MNSHSFLLDRKLFDFLKKEKRKSFTTKELRDSYASTLKGMDYKLADVRLYVYEEIRRLMRAGWVIPDKQKKTRNQVYHLQVQLSDLNVELIDEGFNKWLSGGRRRTTCEMKQRTQPAIGHAPAATDEVQRLQFLMKEAQLELLASVGEAERFKQIMKDIPELKDKIEKEYLSVRDQSSRLLGHVRAIEKTLRLVAGPS